ncbi:unnamed protein product [Mucor hiemalis]
MIDDLPFELFNQCMSYLSSEEKLTCLQVCQAWNKKVLKLAYETVEVDSEERLWKMHTFFQNNKELGELVSVLLIFDCEMLDPMYLSLPSLFPNVKSFWVRKSIEDILYPRGWNKREAETQFSKWNNTIEEVAEGGSPICTKALFTRSSCPKLKSLVLNCFQFPDMLGKTQLIKNLKQCAPNLTHLELLFEIKFEIEIMEEMLNNSPNLLTLKITDCDFTRCTKRIDFSKVVAHPGLKSLVVRDCEFIQTEDQWFAYFSKKFVHLKNLYICNIGDTLDLDIPSIEYYSVQFPNLLTEELVKALDQSGMQLKRVDLGNHYYVGSIYKSLMNSKQKDTLETITSTGVSCQRILHQFPDFISRLTEFTSLKHLTIFQCDKHFPFYQMNSPRDQSIAYNVVPLDLLIKNSPNLETLKLDFTECILEYEKDEPMPDCKLKELVLVESKINAVNRFESTVEGYTKSWDYVKNTVLPNTIFVTPLLHEARSSENSYIESVCEY